VLVLLLPPCRPYRLLTPPGSLADAWTRQVVAALKVGLGLAAINQLTGVNAGEGTLISVELCGPHVAISPAVLRPSNGGIDLQSTSTRRGS